MTISSRPRGTGPTRPVLSLVTVKLTPRPSVSKAALAQVQKALEAVAAAWTNTWARNSHRHQQSHARVWRDDQGLWNVEIRMGLAKESGPVIGHRHETLHVAVDLMCLMLRRMQPYIDAADREGDWARWREVRRAAERAVKVAHMATNGGPLRRRNPAKKGALAAWPTPHAVWRVCARSRSRNRSRIGRR